ncbi:N5,N10-methylene tetrahydromethanopterin reductase [Actinomadura cremea]|nr:N5,N10-methylene tetrahydromethanopterin reductase [Actinomadura cremea]
MENPIDQAPVAIGVLLPTGQAQWGAGGDPGDLVRFAVTAERLGFDSLFVNDSLISPRIEALTMLAALAPATERVTLGTGALLPVLRRPIQTAEALASIDLLSGGRLAVAVGAGFPGRFGRPLHTWSQVPWEHRFTRLDETVALWRALWNGAASFHGELLSFSELPPATRPHRTGGPPVWLGGSTRSALARTGRHYDGWLPYPPDPADYTAGLHAVHDAATTADRDTGRITPALFVTVHIGPDGRGPLDAYARATYGMPLTGLEKIQAVITGTAVQVTAALTRYIAAGARHLILRPAALDLADQHSQIEQIAAILPALRQTPEASRVGWRLDSGLGAKPRFAN